MDLNLKYKIWLDQDGKVFGEGPYELLAGVRESGSLSQAARNLNMSYSRAHGLMKTLSEKLGFDLLDSQAGGVGGGGTVITPQAEDLMRRYEAFMKDCDEQLHQLFAKHFDGAPAAAAKPAAPAEYSVSTEAAEPAAAEEAPVLPSLNLEPLSLRPYDVVALVGGGGKTSIMYSLAEDLAKQGAKVIVTTTTKISLPTHGAADRLLIGDSQSLLNQLNNPLPRGSILALGSAVRGGKLLGIDPALVKEMIARKKVDYILVEADGAAGKPFKAPAAYEPVIPEGTTLLLSVVGIDALNQQLDEAHFHRVEQLTALSGLAPGALVDAEAIAEVMLSPQGGRKLAPPDARWLPVINKLDNEQTREAAKEIARALVKRGVEEVLFASVHNYEIKVRLWRKDSQ